MNIILNKTQSFGFHLIWARLQFTITNSRFTAEITNPTPRKIKILKVRVKAGKAYCGNHPYGCEIGGVDKKAKFLEGADWVEFDDLLNDALDSLLVDAKVSSSVCILRKGRRRRTNYDGNYNGGGRNAQWDKDAPDHDYEDYCGRIAPPSEFPEGTPGIYSKIGYYVVG